MDRSAVANNFRALYPAELIQRYASGERDFPRINLYRAELEFIAKQRGRVPAAGAPSDRHNPLWCDFLTLWEREFEWDAFGSFVPVELDDSPPTRDLSGACLADACFDGSFLDDVDLTEADLRRCSFRHTIMRNVNLRGADLDHADLRWAVVSGEMTDVNLYMARLQRSRIGAHPAIRANLGRTKLRRATLRGSDLREVDFSKARFDETNLNETDLRGADLSDVKLESVYVTGARIDAWQVPQLLAALRITIDEDSSQRP